MRVMKMGLEDGGREGGRERRVNSPGKTRRDPEMEERGREGGREGCVPEPLGPELDFNQKVVEVQDGMNDEMVGRKGGREGGM